MRVLIAAILGGLVFFFWGFVAHEVLGLGQVGIKDLPNEQVVLPVLSSSITEPGFYFFPGLGLPANPSSEQKKAAMQQFQQKASSGPMGFVIYHPIGNQVLTMRQLGREFGLDVTLALIAAILLSWTGGLTSFASRVAFVTLAGFMAALLTNFQYWNWYGFPANYTLAIMATQVIGFFLAAIVIALLVGRRRSTNSI